MNLLLDMNLSPRWVEFLRSNGFDAVHWSGVGAASAPDSAIMEHARQNDFVILTHDLDFSAMLAANHSEKPSVVQLRAQNITPEAIGGSVISALRLMHDELQQGALITIDPERARVRILPLQLSS